MDRSGSVCLTLVVLLSALAAVLAFWSHLYLYCFAWPWEDARRRASTRRYRWLVAGCDGAVMAAAYLLASLLGLCPLPQLGLMDVRAGVPLGVAASAGLGTLAGYLGLTAAIRVLDARCSSGPASDGGCGEHRAE